MVQLIPALLSEMKHYLGKQPFGPINLATAEEPHHVQTLNRHVDKEAVKVEGSAATAGALENPGLGGGLCKCGGLPALHNSFYMDFKRLRKGLLTKGQRRHSDVTPLRNST